ncbi:MAG: DUF1292 domain-containing protein [Chitinophagales bacterium]
MSKKKYNDPTTTHWLSCFENDKFKGHYAKYPSYQSVLERNDLRGVPYSQDNQNQSMSQGGTYNSLKLAPSTWVMVYDQANYYGQCRLFGSSVTNLDEIGRSTDGYPYRDGSVHFNKNWQNAIESFRVFSQRPLGADSIVKNFIRIYQNLNTGKSAIEYDSTANHRYIKTYTQNVEYRIYYPRVLQTGNILRINFDVRQIKYGKNNVASIKFGMDARTGAYTGEMSVKYTIGDLSLPKWIIPAAEKVVEDTIDYAVIAMIDAAEEEATDGEATPYLIEEDGEIESVEKVFWDEIGNPMMSKAVSFAGDHINQAIAEVAKLLEQGGLTYLPSVARHAIQRATYACMKEINDNARPSPSIYLDYDVLQSSESFDIDFDTNSVHDNEFIKFYEYSRWYRLYKPDYSPGYLQMGMFCSCNLDSLNDDDDTDGTKNDHLALDLAYGMDATLWSIQGTIYDHAAPNSDDDYTAPNSGVVAFEKDDDGNKAVLWITPDKEVVHLNSLITGDPYYTTQLHNLLSGDPTAHLYLINIYRYIMKSQIRSNSHYGSSYDGLLIKLADVSANTAGMIGSAVRCGTPYEAITVYENGPFGK